VAFVEEIVVVEVARVSSGALVVVGRVLFFGYTVISSVFPRVALNSPVVTSGIATRVTESGAVPLFSNIRVAVPLLGREEVRAELVQGRAVVAVAVMSEGVRASEQEIEKLRPTVLLPTHEKVSIFCEITERALLVKLVSEGVFFLGGSIVTSSVLLRSASKFEAEEAGRITNVGEISEVVLFSTENVYDPVAGSAVEEKRSPPQGRRDLPLL